MQREMYCHCPGTPEGKLLQKVQKSRAHKNQMSSSSAFVAAGKIAEFESPKTILDDRQ
jgi:hypothetical protein